MYITGAEEIDPPQKKKKNGDKNKKDTMKHEEENIQDGGYWRALRGKTRR